MEDIPEQNSENESNDDLDLKSLEEFFNKEIPTNLSPQEMIIVSEALNHVAKILNIFSSYAKIAVFDKTEFTKDHPEYKDIDFSDIKNIDKDTVQSIAETLSDKSHNQSEEFNKGDILIKSISDALLKIATKLYDNYEENYKLNAPEVSAQFFTLLSNCLDNSIMILKGLFSRNH